MARLKMSWRTEGGQIVCRWVDAGDVQHCDAASAGLGGAAASTNSSTKPEAQGAELPADKAA